MRRRRRLDPFERGLLAGLLLSSALDAAFTHPKTALPLVRWITVGLFTIAAAGLIYSYIRHRRGTRSMAILTADQILTADDRRFEVVPCPEWGGDVRLRSLSGAERDDFEAKSLKGKGKDATVNLRNVRARLVALCAVDSDGLPLFQPSQVMKLGEKNAAVLSRLYDKASEMCGLSEEDVKELVADFGETQTEDSATG